MDFWADLRGEILQNLPFDKNDAKLVQALADMPAPELLIRFYNWLGRLVHPHTRSVYKSTEFISSSIAKERGADISFILEKIRGGVDLGPHLSKDIRNGYVHIPPGRKKNLNRRADLDMLLNDWGVHHLHISNKLCVDGFVERDGPLIFAIFTGTNCYLLDIMGHGEWTNQHLVEIAIRNWPDSELFLELRGVIGTQLSRAGRSISSDDRKKLRGAGISTFIEVDGRVLMSRSGGISSAGTSTGATQQAQKLLRSLKLLTDNLKNNPNFLKLTFDHAQLTYPDQADFHLTFRNLGHTWDWIIQESLTKISISIL